MKYQEPLQKIDNEVIDQIFGYGVYPKEYVLKVMSNNKDMNYATAMYNLLLKRKQMLLNLN